MKITIGIIDDEQHAIETLKYDLLDNYGNEVDIVFTATDPFDGARAARTLKPDALFLDIVMPGLSGIELYRLIDDLGIRVIFTTAHSEYSSLAKKANAFGFLSKPVMPNELNDICKRLFLNKATQ